MTYVFALLTIWYALESGKGRGTEFFATRVYRLSAPSAFKHATAIYVIAGFYYVFVFSSFHTKVPFLILETTH